jgi:hypothetical protein
MNEKDSLASSPNLPYSVWKRPNLTQCEMAFEYHSLEEAYAINKSGELSA